MPQHMQLRFFAGKALEFVVAAKDGIVYQVCSLLALSFHADNESPSDHDKFLVQ